MTQGLGEGVTGTLTPLSGLIDFPAGCPSPTPLRLEGWVGVPTSDSTSRVGPTPGISLQALEGHVSYPQAKTCPQTCSPTPPHPPALAPWTSLAEGTLWIAWVNP